MCSRFDATGTVFKGIVDHKTQISWNYAANRATMDCERFLLDFKGDNIIQYLNICVPNNTDLGEG
jgi:hypothetical protein